MPHKPALQSLAEFELLVLLAALRLGTEEAYTVSIAEHIQARTGRSVRRANVYTTLQRLGIRGSLKTTLASTNPCESMIECVRRTSRNVKRWQSGEMALRWTAAGMLEAERQFRRIIGSRDLAKLALAIERDLAHTTPPSPTEEAGAAQRRAPVVPFAPAHAGGGDRGR